MTNIFRIEETVCSCVNDALTGLRNGKDDIVTVDKLYSGTSKVSLSVTVARQFTYFVMHDLYHLSYSVIAERSRKSVRSVVACVAKVRCLMFMDEIYIAVADLVKKRM